MKKKVLLFAGIATVCAIGLILLMSFGHNQLTAGTDSKATVKSIDKITLSYVDTTHAVLAGIALHQGYFLQEGLEVSPRTHSFGKSALDDLLKGRADFATVADPPIMMEIMKGGDISVIATIQTSNRDNAVIALKKSDIAVPADLKGRKIAATLGTTSDFFMDAFLVANGIGWYEVEKVGLKPEELNDALMSGKVDAVSAFQPFVAQMQKELGDRIISFTDESIYTWTFSIVAKREFIRKNPERVAKLLRALLRAEDFVKTNPAEAQKIVAGYSGMDIDIVSEIWSHMRFAVTLEQFLVLALEDESRWAVNSGIIKNRKIPNYLKYFYFEGLESVKPEAVRILRRKSVGN
ncbi:MAG: NrtA/SsuA/CpmA family ABC transporter substrate-binding protein [Syntrophales bacterium]|jgi:NitT/TauT family transport system substrate-binding protein|nr:NrtA/SsuA/CpmA family ABC transporter substrate-binding protein [Syntrophales bacterium]MDY0045384.1 NrtA/SsuA/CpmA family ABC transporter substrate-binding protein [Syntrophales bacterium]